MDKFEEYRTSNGRLLRCGYTTGTCAALAAKAAFQLLFHGNAGETISIVTPKGFVVEAQVEHPSLVKDKASCAIAKDAGDDTDATDGMLVFATVQKVATQGIHIDGGNGVGRVTLPGLDQPVGAAAINSVPRRMIRETLEEACEFEGYHGGLDVIISIPGGEEIAKRTFNPKLGIVGGISVLGTSGIVEPQSLQALVDTIEVELKVHRAAGTERLILTPGNYGEQFLETLRLDPSIPIVKCSNFIGDTLDAASCLGFREILLVGHIGKFVKLAGGIMNTHNRFADCRLELFAAHAAACGASQNTIVELFNAPTTDEAIRILDSVELRSVVMKRLVSKMSGYVVERVGETVTTGLIVFSNVYGILGRGTGTEAMLDRFREHGRDE